MKIKILSFILLGCSLTTAAQEQDFMSLETYRKRVEGYSQVLKQQQLQAIGSTEARKAAHTGFLPAVDLVGDGTINLREIDKWNEPLGEYRTYTFKAQAMVSQPLYTGGSLNAKYKIAKDTEELAGLNVELTMDQIIYQSDSYYWSASAAYATLQSAMLYQDIVKKQYDLTNERFTLGAISRNDLLMITTRLKEAELQLIQARQSYILALQKLNTLMGIDPNAPVGQLSPISTSSEQQQIMTLEEVLQRRPEYASTIVDIRKSETQRKAALSQYNPQVSMYVAGGWATLTPNLGQPLQFTPVVGLNLSIPIFRWGARFKTSREQDAYIGIQKLQQSYVADNINQELSSAITNLNETGKLVTTAEETITVAEENLDLVTYSYNEGNGTMVDVLSAQLSWIQAENSLISAQLSQKMAVASYRKTISE